MDQQLIDWIDFCEERKDFDKSHFYTLFFEGEAENVRRSKEELEVIFRYLPKGQELLNKSIDILTDTDKEELPVNIEVYLEENTRNDLLQKKIILKQEQEGSLIDLIEKPIQFTNDIENVIKSHSSSWVDERINSIIGDYFIDNLEFDTHPIFALKEALYGFTTDLNIVRYLLSPLLNTKINFDYYYNIWKVGGDYSVTENGIIVSRYISE